MGGPWRALGWKMGSRGGARRPSTALSPLPSFKPPNATTASLPAPGDKVAISRIHLLTDDVDFGDTNRSKSGPSPTSVRAGECKLGWPSDPDGRPAGAGCPGGGRAARRGAPSACAPPAPPGRPRSPSRGERRACGGRGTPGEGGAAVGSASPSVVCRPPPRGKVGSAGPCPSGDVGKVAGLYSAARISYLQHLAESRSFQQDRWTDGISRKR